MNFLAHLFLTRSDAALLTGNFLGDFLSNRELLRYPERIRQGVRLHRQIDSFTDTHPLVLKGARRLYPYHHKYAPVVIDVFYDYLLAHNWSAYAEEPLPAFTQRVYGVLERYQSLMPAYLQRRLSLMIADNWLQQYGALDGLAFTFSRMQRRVSKPAHLENAVDSLLRDFGLLNEEFNGFFPEVIEFVNEKIGTG